MESRSPQSTTQSINCDLACKMVAKVPKKKKKGFRICHVPPPATSWKVVKWTTQEQQKQSVCNRISSITTCKLQSSPPQVLESKTDKSNIEGF